MSRNQLAQYISEAPLSLDEKLRWHLVLLPKLGLSEIEIPIMRGAILIVNLGLDPQTEFALPAGRTFKGACRMTAQQIIDVFLLSAYLTAPTQSVATEPIPTEASLTDVGLW